VATDAFLSACGAHPIQIDVELAPLPGAVHWLCSSEDAAALTALALFTERKDRGFSDPHLQSGFYHYLGLEALTALEQLRAFGDLSLRMMDPSPLPEAGALCIDVKAQLPSRILWGRIVVPPSFQEAFKRHFAERPPLASLSSLSRGAPVVLKIEAGTRRLSAAQWRTVQNGDLLILDHCSFDPSLHKGTVTLTLENTPLFRAKLKHGSVKILDYAYYREDASMIDDEGPEEKFFEAEASPEESQQPLVDASDIPLLLTVEIARVRLPLEQLLQLSPGNVLDLSVLPERGVSLMAEGKCIARGELVKLGDMLGVRILDIGQHVR
jgi:flagellar motor switch protein FliN/FliY